MKEGREEAIDHYWSLRPDLYEVLDKLELRQLGREEKPSSDLMLEITLRPFVDEYDSNQRLKLIFLGVAALKMNLEGLTVFSPLEITAMKSAQWEYVKYSVQDDTRQIAFFCRSFTAEMKEK